MILDHRKMAEIDKNSTRMLSLTVCIYVKIYEGSIYTYVSRDMLKKRVLNRSMLYFAPFGYRALVALNVHKLLRSLTVFPCIPTTFTGYVAVKSLFLPPPVLTNSIALPVNGTEPDLPDEPKVISASVSFPIFITSFRLPNSLGIAVLLFSLTKFHTITFIGLLA
jgi:hypothetical protein